MHCGPDETKIGPLKDRVLLVRGRSCLNTEGLPLLRTVREYRMRSDGWPCVFRGSDGLIVITKGRIGQDFALLLRRSSKALGVSAAALMMLAAGQAASADVRWLNGDTVRIDVGFAQPGRLEQDLSLWPTDPMPSVLLFSSISRSPTRSTA